jgi:hypothetical protein
MKRSEIYKIKNKFSRDGLNVYARITPTELISLSKRTDVFIDLDFYLEKAYERKSKGIGGNWYVSFTIEKNSEIVDIISET